MTLSLCVLAPARALAAAPISADQAVAHLNAQRAANGIPGDLAASPALGDGCDKHDNYMLLNGNRLQHGETEGNPGYTPEGAGVTSGGFGEVLSGGGETWDDAWASPWATAPIHLLLMFAPSETQAGYADSHGFACMRLQGGRLGLGGAFSLPGNGAVNVPTTMNAGGEGPYSPNDVAGIPENEAGYNILLFHPGAAFDIAGASLVGPLGPVEIRTVDTRSPVPSGGTFQWGGSVVIPTRPLDADAPYTLDVVFTDGTPYHSTFTTEHRDPGLQIETGRSSANVLRVGVLAVAPIDPAKVTATGPGGRIALVRGASSGTQTFSAKATRPGLYTACAAAGGLGTGYSADRRCATATLTASQAAKLALVNPRKLRLTVGRAFGAPRTGTLSLYARGGRRLSRRRVRLTAGTRTFARPGNAVSARLTAPAAHGYTAVRLLLRLR
jgi:hypothetical protein